MFMKKFLFFMFRDKKQYTEDKAAAKHPDIITQIQKNQPSNISEEDNPQQQSAQISAQSERNRGKKILVLDLDETLVHSSFQPIQNSDWTLKIYVQNMPFYVYVKKRPGVDQFIKEMSKYYEIVVYTASLAEYADPVIDLLDNDLKIEHRLFRESCTLYQNIFVKDLSLLGRDLKDVIIVDNSENSFKFQPCNALLIKSFFDDEQDRELYNLTNFLKFTSHVYDVRSVNQWYMTFQTNSKIEYLDMYQQKQVWIKMNEGEQFSNEFASRQNQDIEYYDNEDLYQSSQQQSYNQRQANKQQKEKLISQNLSSSENSSKQLFKNKLSIEQIDEQKESEEETTSSRRRYGQKSNSQLRSDKLLKNKKNYKNFNSNNTNLPSPHSTSSEDRELGDIPSEAERLPNSVTPTGKDLIAKKAEILYFKQGNNNKLNDQQINNNKKKQQKNLSNKKAKDLEEMIFSPHEDGSKYFVHKTQPYGDNEEMFKQNKEKIDKYIQDQYESIRFSLDIRNINSPISKIAPKKIEFPLENQQPIQENILEQQNPGQINLNNLDDKIIQLNQDETLDKNKMMQDILIKNEEIQIEQNNCIQNNSSTNDTNSIKKNNINNDKKNDFPNNKLGQDDYLDISEQDNEILAESIEQKNILINNENQQEINLDFNQQQQSKVDEQSVNNNENEKII